MTTLATGRRIRQEIAQLDPFRDDRDVAHLSLEILHGNPMLVHALFTVSFIRQVAVPSMAKVLYRKGTGKIMTDTALRNDDTMVFFGNFIELGYDTPEGTAWIERLNTIHSHFPIRNEDSLYTLATLALEPQRLADVIGARPFSDAELDAQWSFWSGVAAAQRIEDIPRTRADLAAWMGDFEAREYTTTPEGTAVTLALVDDFATRWFPRLLQPYAVHVLSAFCDETLRSVQNLPEPNPVIAALARSVARIYFAVTPIRPVRRDRSFVKIFGTSKYGERGIDAVGYQRPSGAGRG
ncbi:MAG: oxygenase MpaB family protein [Rhodococcus sp. (in: high G+C Gram-positive bacteria)]|uniref:oxygenase MpaB family protein n=1 Tax=Rhodococcus sp. TaxID=1831 RepID=UPI003BB05F07